MLLCKDRSEQLLPPVGHLPSLSPGQRWMLGTEVEVRRGKDGFFQDNGEDEMKEQPQTRAKVSLLYLYPSHTYLALTKACSRRWGGWALSPTGLSQL